MSIDRLRGIVRRVGGDAGPLELAELLWLAHHLPGPAPSDRPPAPETVRPPPDDPDRVVAAAAPPEVPEPAGAEPHRESAPLHLQQAKPTRPAPRTGPAGVATAATDPRGAAVTVPEAPGIGDRLTFTRSLRPLKKAVPTGPPNLLDEAATADHVADSIANDRPWRPVFRPALRRWMSAIVVIERSDSMRLWTSVTAALPGLIAETGAFSDVQTWYLQSDGTGTPFVRPARAGTPRPPGELIDPSGRRAVLLVTDCVGPIWTSGRHRDLLRRWGRHAHVGIFQPFPERLWSRTHAPTSLVRLTSPRPGAPNAEFTVRMLDGMPDPPAGTVAIPVMQIEPSWWKRWARFAASGTGTRTAATLVPARDTDDEPDPPDPEPEDGEPETLVRRFRAVASPPAVRLAGYLAMSKPYLPVMRHVHRAMLSPVRQHHLAEVLLSGLMQPVEARHGVYEFVNQQVKEQLLLGVSRSETYLFGRVSDQIDELIDRTPGGFPAVLGGTGALRVAGLESPFAILSPEGVRRLHGGNGIPTAPEPPPEPVAVPVDRITALLDQPVVPLLGRDDELAALIRWYDGDRAVPALLIGSGGAGKTRLAFELINRRRQAGFEIFRPDEPLAPPSTARLVVIDAADLRTDDFVADAAGLIADPGRRVLFTARSEGTWWRQLASPGALERRLAPLAVTPSVLADVELNLLAELAAVSDRIDWAADLPDLSTPPDRLQPGPLVTGTLLRLLGASHPDAAAAVTDHLVRRESDHWTRAAVRHRVSAPLFDLVAAAVLFGAPTTAEARALVARVMGRPAPDDQTNRATAWLHAVLPSDDGDHFGRLRPPAVADRVTATAAIRQPDLVRRGFTVASEAQCQRAITVLGRAAATHPGLAPVLHEAVAGRPELLRWAAASVAGLPEAGRAVLVDAIGTALDGPTLPPELIRDVLTVLPDHERLFDGRSAGSAETLVGHYRRLVIFSRQYEPMLAGALRRLWLAQREYGLADDALATTREEVEIHGRLARAEPGRHVEQRADALLRHADQLVDTGNATEAVRFSAGAVAAFGELTRDGGTGYLARHARALLRRADVLEQLGRRPEAVGTVTDAVDVYRRMPAEDTGRHRADLALALVRQALGRGALGDHLNAVQPAIDSVAIYRDLVIDDRHRYRSGLAHALFVCALEHGDLGAMYEARANAIEAVAIYRQLAETRPEFRDRLSAAWHLLAAQHYELSAYGESREALAAAVAALPPDDVAPPLSRRLRAADLYRTFALELGRAGRPAEAEAAMREAVTRYAALAQEVPAYAPLLADALSHRADWLGELRRELEATDCLTRAVRIYDSQLTRTPSLRANILDCHRRLSILWAAIGDQNRARRHAEAAKG